MLKISFVSVLSLLILTSTSTAQDWTSVQDMPGLGRHHPANFTLDGHGYIVTGSTSGAASTDDVYRYDPTSNSWTTLPDFPGPDRSYSYGGSYDGKGYVGFGSAGGYFRDLWEYDPVSEAWTELATCPGAGRAHPAFVVTDDGKIYVGCGNNQANLRDWWEYEIATDTWTQRAWLPGSARHHPYYFNIGDVPYVGFGHGSSIFKTFYRYNPGDDTWTQMQDFPGVGRVAGTQFSYGGKGYILSGENEQHQQFPTGEFWEYDPDDDSWTALPVHPGSSRWAPGNFLIDNTVYFHGGLSTSALEKDMMKYVLLPTTDVDEPQFESQLAVQFFPNPVTGTQLRILDPGSTLEAETVRLLTADGRRIADIAGSSNTIEIPGRVASGQYYVAFTTKDGRSYSRPITVLR